MQTGIAFNVVWEQAKRIANPDGIRPGDADKIETTKPKTNATSLVKSAGEIWTNKKVTEISAFTTTQAAFQGSSHNRW